MRLLHLPFLTNGLVGTFNNTQIVLQAGSHEHLIQFVKVGYLGHGNQEVATPIAYIALNATFFVTLSRCAEATLEEIVAAETNEGSLLFSVSPSRIRFTAALRLS